MIRLHVGIRKAGRTGPLIVELADLIDDGYLVTTDPTDDAHVLVVGPQADRLVAAARALAPNVVRVRPRRWTAQAQRPLPDPRDPETRSGHRPPVEGLTGPGVDDRYRAAFIREYLNPWTRKNANP